MSAPTHGVVTLGALDLRVRPDHRAELGSQLLMGEVVELLGRERAGWRRVRCCTDGYRGWVRTWGLVQTGAVRARRWTRLATATIRVPIVDLRVRPTLPSSAGPLFLGGRVIAGRARGGWRPAELPDGRRGWLPEAALSRPGRKVPTLMDRIRTLLGVPYLWGGRTPAGLDCSGLVQLVLAEQGLALPRDAHAQWRASRPLARHESPREGDLAFFSTSPGAKRSHVGIALGGMYFAHSRGRVRIDSLEPGEPLHAPDLTAQFRGWARPGAVPVLPRVRRTGSQKRRVSP